GARDRRRDAVDGQRAARAPARPGGRGGRRATRPAAGRSRARSAGCRAQDLEREDPARRVRLALAAAGEVLRIAGRRAGRVLYALRLLFTLIPACLAFWVVALFV